MNETTKRDAVNFRCEQCGRGGKAIFTCPERPSGRCPYVEEWREKTRSPLLVVPGIFLTFFGLIGICMYTAGNWGIQITLVLLAAGLILMLGGTFLDYTHSEKVQLYNSNSGVRLQRTTLLGIKLSYRWVTSGKPVPIHLALSQPLAYPPSITALPTELYISMEQAVAILRTALIGLLAKGHIQVYHFQSHEFKRGIRQSVQDVYSIVATQEFAPVFKGRLEREIRRVLANWSKRKEAKDWPDGPPIYDLVRAIYQSDKKSPQGWLAQLVAKDATAQGWGQIIKGFLRKRFELDADHVNQIQQEREIMKALSRRLAQLHPDFSLELDKQIEKGVKSREERDVDVYVD